MKGARFLMKTQVRYSYIDIMRVLAMLGVVLLHSSFYCLGDNPDTALWSNVNILTSLATASVPVFFMISGSLLLSSEKTLSPMYTVIHRLPRLVLPLLFWSVISVAKDFRYTAVYSSAGFVYDDFMMEICKIPSEPVSIHFWFMYSLIPLYILSPVIKLIADNADKKILGYMLGIWIIAALVYEVRFYLPSDTSNILNISVLDQANIANGYLGYFMLGYFLSKKNIKINFFVLLGIAAALLAVISFGTYHYTVFFGSYCEHFKSYSDILVMALSVCLFLMGKKITGLPAFIAPVIRYLSNVSFGVYLTHNIFISIFSHEGMELNTGEGCFTCFWITTVLSVLVTSLLMAIPVVGKITTGSKHGGMWDIFLGEDGKEMV